jgi:hypothetical protein
VRVAANSAVCWLPLASARFLAITRLCGRPPISVVQPVQLCPLFERGNVLGGQAQAHRCVEEIAGFSGGETQVGGAQFGELPTGAQPGEGEARVFTSSDDQVQRRRQVLEDEGQGFVKFLGLDHMVVVQDQGNLNLVAGDFIQQRRQHRCGRGRLPPRSMKDGQRLLAETWRNRLQRRDEVCEELGRVVIRVVERQLGHQSLAAGDPLTDQQGFAKVGRGRDDRHAGRML